MPDSKRLAIDLRHRLVAQVERRNIGYFRPVKVRSSFKRKAKLKMTCNTLRRIVDRFHVHVALPHLRACIFLRLDTLIMVQRQRFGVREMALRVILPLENRTANPKSDETLFDNRC